MTPQQSAMLALLKSVPGRTRSIAELAEAGGFAGTREATLVRVQIWNLREAGIDVRNVWSRGYAIPIAVAASVPAVGASPAVLLPPCGTAGASFHDAALGQTPAGRNILRERQRNQQGQGAIHKGDY